MRGIPPPTRTRTRGYIVAARSGTQGLEEMRHNPTSTFGVLEAGLPRAHNLMGPEVLHNSETTPP